MPTSNSRNSKQIRKLRHRLVKRDGNLCLCCGKFGHSVKLTIDHIWPLSKGGTWNINNLQLLCAQCNTEKGAKTINYRTRHKGRI